MAADIKHADIFRVMRANIFVDLDRKLLAAQDSHAFQAEISGHSLHDLRGGYDIVFRYDRTLLAGDLQGIHIDVVRRTFSLDVRPTCLVRGVRKYVAEEQIADHDVAEVKGDNALGEAGMTLVGIRGALMGCFFAGAGVAGSALLCGVRVGADDLAYGRNLLRVGGKLMEGIVENGDADSCDIVKVPEKGV